MLVELFFIFFTCPFYWFERVALSFFFISFGSAYIVIVRRWYSAYEDIRRRNLICFISLFWFWLFNSFQTVEFSMYGGRVHRIIQTTEQAFDFRYALYVITHCFLYHLFLLEYFSLYLVNIFLNHTRHISAVLLIKTK